MRPNMYNPFTNPEFSLIARLVHGAVARIRTVWPLDAFWRDVPLSTVLLPNLTDVKTFDTFKGNNILIPNVLNVRLETIVWNWHVRVHEPNIRYKIEHSWITNVSWMINTRNVSPLGLSFRGHKPLYYRSNLTRKANKSYHYMFHLALAAPTLYKCVSNSLTYLQWNISKRSSAIWLVCRQEQELNNRKLFVYIFICLQTDSLDNKFNQY